MGRGSFGDHLGQWLVVGLQGTVGVERGRHTRIALRAHAGARRFVEREWRGPRVGGSYDLGGALFMSASRRWDLASYTTLASRDVAVLGAGVRLLPTRIARATLRLDVSMPVGATSGLSHRPIVSFTLTPWLEHERHRDGRPNP